MKKGPWKVAYFCVKCKKEMSNWTMMYSNGVCPYCGNVEPGTVVDCIESAKRWVMTGKWYSFWKGYWEYKNES